MQPELCYGDQREIRHVITPAPPTGVLKAANNNHLPSIVTRPGHGTKADPGRHEGIMCTCVLLWSAIWLRHPSLACSTVAEGIQSATNTQRAAMVRKRKKAEEEEKVWCFYCDRICKVGPMLAYSCV